jgi:hypothetical protein
MIQPASDRPTAYRGPWPILSHRTLADIGAPVIIDGEYREVHGQRFRVTPDRLREDPRKLQAQWDEEPYAGWGVQPGGIVPDHAAQFRQINEALRGPDPDEAPAMIRFALMIGGAALIAGVITAFAIAVRLIGGQ